MYLGRTRIVFLFYSAVKAQIRWNGLFHMFEVWDVDLWRQLGMMKKHLQRSNLNLALVCSNKETKISLHFACKLLKWNYTFVTSWALKSEGISGGSISAFVALSQAFRIVASKVARVPLTFHINPLQNILAAAAFKYILYIGLVDL